MAVANQLYRRSVEVSRAMPFKYDGSLDAKAQGRKVLLARRNLGLTATAPLARWLSLPKPACRSQAVRPRTFVSAKKPWAATLAELVEANVAVASTSSANATHPHEPKDFSR
ncbi:hypothetical protein CJ255_15290 [Candidatus Viridilinea mediisalina]|uniref:Uncharacterized protein n=1 Tax=Candidatus Viridilinea mediisalina TaxID=2024553 RepID=A0A2A6RGW1_9CHLR|nr:hypothetical protein CJ255_15290 [Candidatus Viridilinea mediisalina]